jgi:glyoxylase-like metal-dependent hydrolase (beta-lactamase superfamily II)
LLLFSPVVHHLSLPFILDTCQLGRPSIIAATALETNEGVALFDTGPESTLENVIADLRKSGFAPKDVRHVFLSHIHFDHAGAAWRFADLGAIVYVHPRGAKHLIDPAKLIESAKRIFSDDMQRLWGQIKPLRADRVRILEDNEVVRVPPFEIRAFSTPGHANHHHVYHWDDNLFGGDIAGVRIGSGPPIPPFVPPDLHIESWHESIAKMRALTATNLYLPHFGKVEGSVSEHLDALDERVTRWSEWFRDTIRVGETEPEIIHAFAKYEHDELIAGSSSPVISPSSMISDYEAADPSHMAVSASIRYWNKYHPAEIAR